MITLFELFPDVFEKEVNFFGSLGNAINFVNHELILILCVIFIFLLVKSNDWVKEHQKIPKKEKFI